MSFLYLPSTEVWHWIVMGAVMTWVIWANFDMDFRRRR
jgi:hypothetical protein